MCGGVGENTFLGAIRFQNTLDLQQNLKKIQLTGGAKTNNLQ